MFHMGKIIQSRKVIRDVTYRWIPFLFVVLTVIVCTALLSTSGKPPRGIVVTFSVMAGLLVFFFLSCHLMLCSSEGEIKQSTIILVEMSSTGIASIIRIIIPVTMPQLALRQPNMMSAGSTKLRATAQMSHHPKAEQRTGGDDKVLHSARTTRSYMEVAEPRPHESTQWHPATTRAGAPYQVTQRGAPEYQLHGRSNAVRRKKSELFLDETRDRIRGASAHVDTPGHQAEPRGYPAEAPNSVQAHFALLGVPDVWGLASRLLSDMKPRARLRRKSADDCCDRPPSDDAADLVLLREINRKHVQVHPAAAEVERVRSQKVLGQRLPVRDSNDSGYYSADSSQHPPAWPQPAGPSIAVSSAASTGPLLSSGPSARSSLGAGAENSPNPNSASSMRSEQMARFEMESMEAEGAIRVAMEQPLHDGRLKPRRRSRSC
ncbi:hypothetical protein LA080_006945 [Diaporthe eres]|nr:hypothetical protein LA080_006945 [Diaporthe eres]